MLNIRYLLYRAGYYSTQVYRNLSSFFCVFVKNFAVGRSRQESGVRDTPIMSDDEDEPITWTVPKRFIDPNDDEFLAVSHQLRSLGAGDAY